MCSLNVDIYSGVDVSSFTTHDQNVAVKANTTGLSNKLVVNLSSHELSEAELTLLEKGLKFCPTRLRTEPSDLRKELDTFHKKLRTIHYWSKDDDKKDLGKYPELQSAPYSRECDLKKFKPLSTWKPPNGSINLETFISLNEICLNKTEPVNNIKQNVTRDERRSLRSLSRNRNLIFKPADKGGALVIQDTKDYAKEAYRQLNDTNTYTKLDKDPSMVHMLGVNEYVHSMVRNGEITNSVAGMITNTEVRTPHIYFLPKIHKGTLPPPGRPIVSANGCATEKISAFVDIFLKPLARLITSYVKDTTDFVNKIDSQASLNHGTIIGTMDVGSLYTNIPNDEGIEAIDRVLSKNRPSWANPKNGSIVDLLQMVLKKNNFQFNGDHYLQIGGTAMGTRLAPSYACLYMSVLEEELLELHEYKPKVWLRFIDDIFFIWEHGPDRLKTWIDHLNTAHPTIKFTSETSTERVNFLDTTIIIDHDGKLYTDLYCKDTDSHSYLHFESAHPDNCKNSLPYSQMLRIKRICSKRTDYLKHVRNMIGYFRARNYPDSLLAKSLAKCESKSREELLKPSVKDLDLAIEDKIFMTTTFRLKDHTLESILSENWDNLGRSKSTKKLHRRGWRRSYKRPKNLRDHLVKAAINFNPSGVETGAGAGERIATTVIDWTNQDSL